MNLIPTTTLESFLCWLLLLFVLFYLIGCFSFHGFVYRPSLFCEPLPGLHLRILYFQDNTFLRDLQHFHFIFSLLTRSFVSFLPDFLCCCCCYCTASSSDLTECFYLQVSYLAFLLTMFSLIYIYQGFPGSGQFCLEGCREFMLGP